MLYFYPKDETPGCTKEACSFRDSYEDFVKAGAEVIFEAVQSGRIERVATPLRERPGLAEARDDEGRPLVCYLNPDSPTLREMIQPVRRRQRIGGLLNYCHRAAA